MEELNLQIYSCRKCRLWQSAKHAVPGEGPLNAKIMLIGQNPGADEDELGRPFVGRAGKYLTKTLAEYGIRREEVYITNIVKHVSPQNRKPFDDEVGACLPYLINQINFIKPKLIVLLGASAKETPRIEGIRIHPGYPSLSRHALYKNARKVQAANCRSGKTSCSDKRLNSFHGLP